MGRDAKINLRFMNEVADLPDILRIEKDSYVHPLPEAAFRDLENMRSRYPQVALIGGELVGYMIAEVFPTKVCVHNLTVASLYRRRGVGSAFLDYVKKKILTPVRRTRIEVYARESSLPAHLFLRSNGFIATGVSREYFKDETGEGEYEVEDAYRFIYEVNAPVKANASSAA